MFNNKSGILIIAICSNTKITSGELQEYHPETSIQNALGEEFSPYIERLYDGRSNIHNLITSGEVSRDGKQLCNMPFNDGLVYGADLNFTGIANSGAYLPAIQRYDGRFYKELGNPRERLLFFLRNSLHHFLIVSGLYGVITPLELIQCYSCNVSDHPYVSKQWTADSCLTETIASYIKKFKITKVFDFMATDSYRNLVAWETIRNLTHDNVLHGFSKQFAGDALLPLLGIITKRYLTTPESDLMRIQAGHSESTPYKEVIFESVPIPDERSDIVREIERQTARLTYADQIGRMHRNITRMINSIPDAYPESTGFCYRVKHLKGRDTDKPDVQFVLDIADVRNRVEHELYQPNANDWEQLRNKYRTLESWAKENGHFESHSWENVGFENDRR